ncbi:glutathione S-transferase N-terminal domain-containing protein [Acinetobacter sichuanensis]|uniref:glutathione S-transferase family protein n=1 Tax=Acinetobacter sichuanensis TaxID=2136183 RepID=UPI00280F370B|nr:glutathione S-transferase N-terminal domain-containing protein [Acinetobacter sichuanensis]MDQ9022905.1 glutathione S-transferase N-terminal domain-containing protein [Acinetobacter sichuanensis]
MQLYYSLTSPFARKVCVLIQELKIQDQFEMIKIDPWTNPDLRHINPLSKVPTLVLNHKEVLFDSALICEYLSTLKDKALIYPTERVEYFKSLRLQALADGAMSAVGRCYAELKKPEHLQSQDMLQRFQATQVATLIWLEQHLDNFTKNFGIGEISVACLLAYIDFRFPEQDWKIKYSQLAAWFEQVKARDSMQFTQYQV